MGAPQNLPEEITPAEAWKRLANHQREAWTDSAGDQRVFVHSTLGRLNGSGLSQRPRLARSVAYRAAKFQCNRSAAADIVEDCWSEDAEDRIIDCMEGISAPPLIAIPFPSYDDEHGEGFEAPRKGITNALPYQMATYLAERVGGDVQSDIVQIARVGRTKLHHDCRFLWQPRFGGPVVLGRPYILADDVVTLGGTLAALRTYIIGSGGTVIAATALAYREAVHPKFSIAPHTLNMLERLYGPGLAGFWRETIGHEITAITEGEALILVQWAREAGRPGTGNLLALRDRLASAASR